MTVLFSYFPDFSYAEVVDTGLTPESSTKVNNFSIVSLGEKQIENNNYSKLQDAYRYLLNNITKTDSKFLLYPEEFIYKNGLQVEQFQEGAVLNIDSDENIADGGHNKFNYLISSTTAEIGRARALYDGNIAILDITKVIDGKKRHLTFESGAYCNVLHTYIGKHEQCFSGFSDYEKYLSDDKYPDKEETSIAYIYPEDIQGEKLTKNGEAFFGVLILPDLTFGFEDTVVGILGEDGMDNINKFVASGGTVVSSGKSSYLLEKIGFLSEGTVSEEIIVKHGSNRAKLDWVASDKFENKLLKIGAVEGGEGEIDTYFLSSYLVDSSRDPELNEVASFDMSEESGFEFQDTESLETIERPAESMTAISWKNWGNGSVVLLNSHPASSYEKYFPFVFNSMFLAGARDVRAELKVVQKTNPELPDDMIPAYEKDVGLLGSFKVQNYFNEPIHDLVLEARIAKGFMTRSVEDFEECELTELTNDEEYSQVIICNYVEVPAFSSEYFEFPMVITDPYVARGNWNKILSAEGSLSYTRNNGQEKKMSTGKRYLRARNGAEIRAEYNPDPSSFYPLKGEGVYIDNVLTAQNKNHTNAETVEHIAVVPLISPVVDGNDQASLAYEIEFHNDYYQARKTADSYIFPFEKYGNVTASSSSKIRDYDMLDYKSLKCSDTILSADWDTPVKALLMSRAESGLGKITACPGGIKNIQGKDFAYSVENEDLVAQQSYYKDADNYYEHATQRQLVYLDTTEKRGARDFYKQNIPNKMKNGPVAKKKLIFARNDIYFYDNENYPLPEGVDDYDIFFSIDRYSKECGDKRGIVKQGYFDHMKENGIKANEYENALNCEMNKTRIDIGEIENKTNSEVQVSHYLFPIVDRDNIQEASDLADFNVNTEEYQDYPEVKFTKAHTVNFTLDQKTTPRGGRFIFSLPDGVSFNSLDPVAENLISFSADHVAYREIEYDKKKNEIVAYFIRGKMPNETNGKGDVMQASFEKLNINKNLNVGVRLESLEYDIGNPEKMSIYTLADFEENLTFVKKPFLSLPSLIMKFRLHRGENKDKSYFQRYENFEPFVRYGVYIQELLKHRTVYGFSENHPVSDPGLVLKSGVFSTFSNIGASSIPFREYLQTGAHQSIPLSSQTSRVDYQDIWKRQWTTPIRTVVPDVPPIPPPLRNFMINTTFEVRDLETGERQLEWASDREAEILHKVKLVNNYPKYFECTVCDGNEFLLRANKTNFLNEKQFIDPDDEMLYPNPNYGKLPESISYPDSDNDGLPDYLEKKAGGDVNSPDTDNDGYIDSTEFVNGYNVNGIGTATSSASSSENIIVSNENKSGTSSEKIVEIEKFNIEGSATSSEEVAESEKSEVESKGTSSEEVVESEKSDVENGGTSSKEVIDIVPEEVSTTSDKEVISRVVSITHVASTELLEEAIEHPEKLYLKRANSAKYGICYQNIGDMASGVYLNDEDRQKILNVQLCENEDDCPDMSNVPTISRMPIGEMGKWNYSKSVEDYYPEGYIQENMWNLNHYDYADNAFMKAYPFHMDNLLPNLDNVRKNIIRPHNIIAQPMYKGLGYKIDYDKNYKSKFYSVEGDKIVGWRSDNLQNKDDTLIGGQDVANIISVDKVSQLKEKFIEIGDMIDADPHSEKALNNIYACLFNRWRVKIDPESGEIVHTDNVYMNNVIPIIPSLNKYDSRLTEYDCGDEYYSPETIHEIDNVVETYSKDWLYFAAGLRGGAKETINIVSRLSPDDGSMYEGAVKVNDGARFTYWNPANGPNSFIVVDNDINIVESKRSDIVLKKEIIPVEVPTFNADIYHAITVEDPNEYQRTFRDSPYVKHYGFGDSVTSVNVGVHKNLKANGSIVSLGEETTIKIELFNNTGYDWNLIKSSDGVMPIESIELPDEAINANDYLHKAKHAIREPTKFNFLKFDIPDVIKDYVEIAPATHNIRVAGMLFDFENINVTRIRDSFKGSYYVDLKVGDNFPEELRGRTYDIGVEIMSEFFDKLPGHNSPVANDYKLEIPSLRFGVPYGGGLGWKTGKVFRASGHSTDISLIDEMPSGVEPIAIKKVSSGVLSQFRKLASEGELRQEKMSEYFNKNSVGEDVEFTKRKINEEKTEIEIDFNEIGIDKFPAPLDTYGYADESKMYFLVKSSASHLPYGETIVNENLKTEFDDCNGFSKISNMSEPKYRKVKASGADLHATYETEIVGGVTGDVLNVQKIIRGEDNFVKTKIRVENRGSAISYHPTVKIYLPEKISIVPGTSIGSVEKDRDGIVEIALGADMPPGDVSIITIVLKQNAEEKEDKLGFLRFFIATANAEQDSEMFIEKIETRFDLTDSEGENQVVQKTADALLIPYALDAANSNLSILVKKNDDGKYKVSLHADSEEELLLYKLFLRNSGGFTEVTSNYSSTGKYNISMLSGETEIYGALYTKGIVMDELGVESEKYFKLAESSIFKLVSSSGNLLQISSIPDVSFFFVDIQNLYGESIEITKTRDVRLRLSKVEDMNRVSISENINFENANIVDFQEYYDYELSDREGYKDIYLRYYNDNGDVSDVVSDKIRLTNEMEVEEVQEEEKVEIPILPEDSKCGGPICADGSLIKRNRIYVIKGGRKYYIPSLQELQKYPNQKINDISSLELKRYLSPKETGVVDPSLEFSDGELIRGTWLYVVRDAKKKYLTDFDGLGEYSDEIIYDMSHEDLSMYPDY